MNGSDNVFLGFLAESGVQEAKKNKGENICSLSNLTPPKTTEGLCMSYQLGTP